MIKQSGSSPIAGVHRDDVERLEHALAGLTYPAQKWQLIAHATHDRPAGHHRTDRRTIEQLWALPAGRYVNLAQVLLGAARTARGHPLRTGAVPTGR
jgi:hypothetical protein